LVVAGVQVANGLHALDGMPELVDVVEGPQACALDGDHHRFPLRVKGGLVRLTLYRTEAVHASEIVYAVHQILPQGLAPQACPGERAGRRLSRNDPESWP